MRGRTFVDSTLELLFCFSLNCELRLLCFAALGMCIKFYKNNSGDESGGEVPGFRWSWSWLMKWPVRKGGTVGQRFPFEGKDCNSCYWEYRQKQISTNLFITATEEKCSNLLLEIQPLLLGACIFLAPAVVQNWWITLSIGQIYIQSIMQLVSLYTNPRNSDLSRGKRYPAFEQPRPGGPEGKYCHIWAIWVWKIWNGKLILTTRRWGSRQKKKKYI